MKRMIGDMQGPLAESYSKARVPHGRRLGD